MRHSLWLFLILALLLLIYHSLSTYPPEEWRDFALGRFYLFRGEKRKAEEEFQKALEKGKSSPSVLLEIGKLFISTGDLARGEKFLRQAAEKHTSVTNYYLLGQCLYREGKLKEAEETLQKALELDPSNPYVLNDLGYIWLEQDKNLEEAVAMLERAAKKAHSPEILDSLGWAYVKTGRVKEGLELLKKAVEGNPYSWELRYHLAVAYEKMGDKAFSQVELKKAEALLKRQQQVIR